MCDGKDVMYAYVDMLDFKAKDIVVALRYVSCMEGLV